MFNNLTKIFLWSLISFAFLFHELSPLYGQVATTATICPGVICPVPCNALEGSDCTCLPEGCDVPVPSTSSSGLIRPVCKSGKVVCDVGTVECEEYKGRIPVCGSKYGYSGDVAGPGCTDDSLPNDFKIGEDIYFWGGSAFCKVGSSTRKKKLKLTEKDCKKENLCESFPTTCREDRTLCKCICPFDSNRERFIPKCSSDDVAFCEEGLTPTCTKDRLTAGCNGGVLFCLNPKTGAISLRTKIKCK